MEYAIKIGKNYIGITKNGTYTEVSKIQDAVKGTTYHKMSNILNNCVSPDKRKKCKIVEVKFPMAIKPSIPEPKTQQNNTNQSLFDEVVIKLRAVGSLGFKQELDDLICQLSKIDLEISDIQHYIEFNTMNAAEGYKAYKMLHDALLRRRVIKDDVAKFQMLSGLKIDDIFNGTLDERLKGFDDRTYTPRVLKELFN